MQPVSIFSFFAVQRIFEGMVLKSKDNSPSEDTARKVLDHELPTWNQKETRQPITQN
jgi:hypothetical protein